ncbi:ATP-binding cassette domain-containing protein [Lactobacillus corticis]|uniref:Antimicrobial peptide ABC transporter ATP-binding protein n=1 Tax=Lactobacillus corticis TaxID=2201249 RepID=A0A916VHQ7_9LACO|nr:ATP-binding cassette domain-containing protein [Lactobacillus corticis]GFZ26445.1 antimicrobial peptide ABC transporter ATP-binding protein [Lactobacillus corticis]
MGNLLLKTIGQEYGDFVVFKDLNFEFNPGKIYAIIGPSGGGKTTLLNSIGRLNDLSYGDIIYDGKNIFDYNVLQYYREIIGYLFQNYALVDEETVRQNLNLVNRHKDRMLRRFLERYGLDSSYLDRKIFTLSGGEAQRVALTRLSMQDPKIVLADEPTGALDADNKNMVLKSLRAMANDNKIVIVATHDEQVKNFADERLNIAEYR